MVKWNTIGEIEHGDYPYEDAVIKTDMLNGDFGTVTDGEFSRGADSLKAIMLVETGDDMDMPEYKIPAGSHVRVVDLAKRNGQLVEVYGAQLPATFAVDGQFISDANGKLVTASAAPYLKVTKIIGNKLGFVAKIVAE